jgi:hypothetical protein
VLRETEADVELRHRVAAGGLLHLLLVHPDVGRQATDEDGGTTAAALPHNKHVGAAMQLRLRPETQCRQPAPCVHCLCVLHDVTQPTTQVVKLNDQFDFVCSESTVYSLSDRLFVHFLPLQPQPFVADTPPTTTPTCQKVVTLPLHTLTPILN